MKTIAFAAAMLAGVAVAAPTASVQDVAKGANGLLEVSYSVTEPAVITFDAKVGDRVLAAENFSSATGEVFRLVSAGSHKFFWYPCDDVQAGGASVKLRVKAWAVDAPPDYMVLDLYPVGADASQRKVRYYENEAQVPGRVTDPQYKTVKLVMRKIAAKGVRWMMGSPDSEFGRCPNDVYEPYHSVTMTNDYYIGIYPLTVGQNSLRANGAYSGNRTAAGINAYSDARGYTGSNNEIKHWPQNSREVDENCGLVYKWQQYTGIALDLPTEEEWEYACRAGTTSALYTGKELSAFTVCDEASEVAWYKGHSTVAISQWMGYHEVGLLRPNAWGLYDMLGMAWEICIDRFSNTATSSLVSTGDRCVLKGGASDYEARWCRAACRDYANMGGWANPRTGNRDTAVRFYAPAIAVK